LGRKLRELSNAPVRTGAEYAVTNGLGVDWIARGGRYYIECRGGWASVVG